MNLLRKLFGSSLGNAIAWRVREEVGYEREVILMLQESVKALAISHMDRLQTLEQSVLDLKAKSIELENLLNEKSR